MDDPNVSETEPEKLKDQALETKEIKTDFSTLQCLECKNSAFKSLLKLAWHLSSVHSVNKCPKCHQTFSDFQDLKQHIQNEHPKTCSICEREVKNLSVHMRTQHSEDTSIKLYKCEIEGCNFATHTQKNLSQHIFVR